MTDPAKKEIPEADAEDNAPSQTAAEEAAASAPDPLAEQLKQQAEEITKFKDLYLRAMAETENVRARARRDLEDSSKYAVTKFARDMVGIVENLQRASTSIAPEARAGNPVLKQVGEGIDMTMQELLGIFERNGIKRVNPAGQKFDHNLHQAVAQVERGDLVPGTVADVLQAGYMLHDRLLKPAMVTVAATPAASPADASA